MTKSLFMLKRELLEISRLCYDKGFVSALDGNMSVRVSDTHILTTGTKTSKRNITSDDLVLVDLNGRKINGKKNPSSELDMHLTIYKHRQDVNAVIHCHPIYSTAFALVRQPITSCYIPEVISVLGFIPVADYATPGTPFVAESLLPHLQKASAILLANHGAVTFGNSLEDAFFKMEKLEHYAQIIFLAKQLGNPVALTSQEITELKKVIEQKGDHFFGNCNPE